MRETAHSNGAEIAVFEWPRGYLSPDGLCHSNESVSGTSETVAARAAKAVRI